MRYAAPVFSRLKQASRRTQVTTAAIAIVLLGGIAIVAGKRLLGPQDSDPSLAIPRDSFLAATVNLAELRRSPLYDVLLGKRSEAVLDPRKLGLQKLADGCGFDPLTRVERLALAVPEEGDRGEIGVAAKVDVTREELERCTAALAGNRASETKRVGSFGVVEDPDGTARPRLAYGHGQMLVAGRGMWFDAMLGAADGKQPSLREAPAHASLRASLTGHEGWHVPTLVLTALLPQKLRDRLKNEMGAELGSKNNSQAIMAGVLGVASVGLALKAGESGQNIDAALELVCDNEDACVSVEKLIGKQRFDWSKELAFRLFGLGPLLDSIAIERSGARVRVTASASADSLAGTLDRVLKARARKEESPPSVPPIPSHRPDEIIPAPRGSR